MHQNIPFPDERIQKFPGERAWTPTSMGKGVLAPWKCRGVIIPTPLVEFSERSLYRACIAFLRGAMANSKNEFSFAISVPIGLKFLHTPTGPQYAKSCTGEFQISSPEKFGAPLNFAFALRPMGRKISNRLYSSFRSCFRLIFSGLLGWRCESLF